MDKLNTNQSKLQSAAHYVASTLLSSGILWGASQAFYAPITFKAALSMGVGLECSVILNVAIGLLAYSMTSYAIRIATDGSNI